MDVTRRRFLNRLGSLSLCIPFSIDLLGEFFGKNRAMAAAQVSRVVVVRDGRALDGGQPVPEIVSSMLREGLEKLLSCDAAQAVNRLFGETKHVGIKVNSLGGRPIAARQEVAYGLADLIVDNLGEDCDVTVWDRSERELRKAGYEIVRKGRVQCLATDSRGIGYENSVRESGEVGSKFSRLLTERFDSVVSLAVLKDHGIAGITGCMKNFYGAIHNPNKYHPNGCDPYVADLFGSDVIRPKHRLSIADGLVGLYSGGPGYKPKYRWEFKGLIIGTDAVAVDRVCLKLIEDKREEMEVPSLEAEERFPQYIFTAGSNGLGSSDLSSIDLIEINRGI
jgi:uncharacterized protein (DUF362 family)